MEPSDRISRSALAKLLGVSEAMVRALEKQDRIKPVDRTADGRVLYDAQQAEELSKQYKPDARMARRKPRQPPDEARSAPLAARVVACLVRRRMTIADTVIETEAHPNFVRRMWLEFTAEGQAEMRRREHEESLDRQRRELDRQQRERERWDRRIQLAKIRTQTERELSRRSR